MTNGRHRSGRNPELLFLLVACLALLPSGGGASAAELLTLSPENYDRYAPEGHEVEAVFGDYVLKNNRITVVVANPDLITGRSSSRWAIAHVAGCVIDIARNDESSDALTAFYPGVTRYKPDAPQRQADFVTADSYATRPDRRPVTGPLVTLTVPEIELGSRRALADLEKLPPSRRGTPGPTMRVRYTLADGWDAVKVETIYHNPTAEPFQWQPHCLLRVDPASDAGNGLGVFAQKSHLCWAYDRWFRQACGVLTLSPGIDANLTNPGQLRVDSQRITVLPGGEYRLTRWLMTGRDVFTIKDIANRLLHRDSRGTRLLVSNGESPVPDAFVTVKSATSDYGSGWTDENGHIDILLPPPAVDEGKGKGTWTLTLQAPGVKAVSVPLSSNAADTMEIHVEKAARLVGRITDEQGRPIPCRVRIQGVGDTADSVFFPSTGEAVVRNSLHSADGRVDHPIPAGQYAVVVTRGPEYDAVIRRINVTSGAVVPLDVTLKRVVDTTGWISADLHNHSTVTGATERFYIKGYRKNPTVDGDSTASQFGRVLNLLAEHIEFAVPTEHNRVSSFAAHITRLGADKHLATVPGVGLTAGRRHTRTHQNAFPIPYRRGDLDGGMLQRPEHIGQLDWLNRWKTGAERFVQIMYPHGTAMFVSRGMDAVDVESLEPLFGDSLDVHDGMTGGPQTRVLEWLQRLREGYRIPAVLNSGAFDNYPGCGRQRTYIRSRPGLQTRVTDAVENTVGSGDPTYGLVTSAKAGHLILTTGPFPEVSATSLGGEDSALPGDTIRSETGRVNLSIRVQCSNQYDINRVQVLVNGRRDETLDFHKDARPDLFQSSTVRFDAQIPLTLNADAFVVVVASGRSVAFASRDQVRPGFVMTNPIWIDVGESGYRPHSPLDDRVATRLEFLRPLLARADADPGRVRVNLTNNGDAIAQDTIRLEFDPPGAFEVIGPRDREYSLPPGSGAFIDFDIRLTTDYLAAGLPVIPATYVDTNLSIRTPRSSKGQGRQPGSTRVHVDHSAMRLSGLTSLDDVPGALRDRLSFPLVSRRDEHLANIQFADAGEHLAILARVHDANVTRSPVIWQGSCLEVYGAMPQQKPIGRMLLTPAAGEHRTEAWRDDNGRIVRDVTIACDSRPTESGYEMWALVPWKLLPVDPRSGQVLLEFRVSAAAARDGPHQRADLFRAGAPAVDHGLYGRVRFEGQVAAELTTIEPLGNSRPGRIGLRLKNRTPQRMRDSLTIRLVPPGLAGFVSPSDSSRANTSTLTYDLASHTEMTHELDIALLPDTNAARLQVEIEDSPQGQVLAAGSHELRVREHRLARCTEVSRLQDIEQALADEPEWVMFTGRRTLTRLRFAVSESHLVVSADMIDPAPEPHVTAWKGSCLEVFGAPLEPEQSGGTRIGQLFLTPWNDDTPARAWRQSGRQQLPEPRIEVQSSPLTSGYRLEALIPLELLYVTPESGGRLEFQSTVFADQLSSEVIRTTLFGSERAYQNTEDYGLFYTSP